MKAARLVVLAVALAAGGVAALLAGRSEPAAEAAGRAAAADRQRRRAGRESRYRAWASRLRRRHDSGRLGRPTPIPAISSARATSPTPSSELAGSIARAPFVAGEPIREAKLVKAKGSGFMAAILPSGMRAVSTEISPETGAGGFHPAERPRRRDPDAARPRGRKSRRHRSARQRDHPRRTSACWRSTRRVEEKNGQKVVIGKTATLELTPGQAEIADAGAAARHAVARAAQHHRRQARRRSNPRTTRGKRDGVNVVRFGVSTSTTPK